MPRRKKGEKKNEVDKYSKARDYQKMILWRDRLPSWGKRPKGPRPGAEYTVCQWVYGQFNTSTNVSNNSQFGNYIQQNSNAPVLGCIGFQFNDMSQQSSYAGIFDVYRIEKVHLRIKPLNMNPSVFNLTAGTNNSVPQLYVVIDRDDANAVGSISALSEYDTCAVVPGDTAVDIKLVPSIVGALSNNAGTYLTADVKRSDDVWVDMAQNTVAFFGVKFGITPNFATSTNVWIWQIEAKYTVSFKHSR